MSMFRKPAHWLLVGSTILFTACGGGGGGDTPAGTQPTATIVEVGQLLFEDTSLSANGNQSCATCHDSTHGFTDPSVTVTNPVSEGSISNAFGNRNAPTAAYAKFTPPFSLNCSDANFTNVPCGGQFLDGRRDTLADQARDPFLNPVEMANADEADVVRKVQSAPYADKFKAVFGETVFNNTSTAYDRIVAAIAAYEMSDEFSTFDSKFDCYQLGKYRFSSLEQQGFDLFVGQAKCSLCHTIPTSGPVLFTNHMYFNIGVPRNPAPVYASAAPDRGLGGINALNDPLYDGMFKTPTLRNVALTAPYMHNGTFSTLEDVVRFYLFSDTKDAGYDVDPTRNGDQEPEIVNNISGEVQNLSFLNTQDNINALVAFMETLTDGSGKGICF